LLYVLAVMAHAAYRLPPPSILSALALLTLATVLISGYQYAREFSIRALQVARV